MDESDFSQLGLFTGEGFEARSALDLDANTSINSTIPAFSSYLIDEKECSQNTVKAFKSDLHLLQNYLPVGQSIGDISTKDLNDFMNWLLNERGVPCSPKSYARRVTTLKVYFKWLNDRGILTSNPSLEVIQVTVTSPLPDLPSDSEIAKALASAEELLAAESDDEISDTRPKLLLTLLLDTGIKKSEATSLVVNHINRMDPENPFLFIRYKDPTKRNKERKLPLDPEWIELLDSYIEQYEITEKLFPWTARNLEYILTEIGERAGLPMGALSFENLRWVFALRRYLDGEDPDRLGRMLGISPVTWRQTRSKLDQLAAKNYLTAP